jgi:hypothetical protein
MKDGAEHDQGKQHSDFTSHARLSMTQALAAMSRR